MMGKLGGEADDPESSGTAAAAALSAYAEFVLEPRGGVEIKSKGFGELPNAPPTVCIEGARVGLGPG